LSEDGFCKKVKILLTLLFEYFDKAGIWVSGASLTDIAPLVQNDFFDNFCVDRFIGIWGLKEFEKVIHQSRLYSKAHQR